VLRPGGMEMDVGQRSLAGPRVGHWAVEYARVSALVDEQGAPPEGTANPQQSLGPGGGHRRFAPDRRGENRLSKNLYSRVLQKDRVRLFVLDVPSHPRFCNLYLWTTNPGGFSLRAGKPLDFWLCAD